MHGIGARQEVRLVRRCRWRLPWRIDVLLGEETTMRVDPNNGTASTLIRKLGFKPGMRVHYANAPDGFGRLLGDLPEGVRLLIRPAPDLDLALLFVTERAALARGLARLQPKLRPAGMIWVAWPKRASRVPTDVSEDVVRELALPRGLVDVKVCAIDEVWSGLKLVVRLQLRS
jgi:hypothetical protein